MATSSTGLNKIHCSLQQIPRLNWRNPLAVEMAAAGQPIVFTETNLVDNVVDKWTLDYLKKHVADDAEFSIYQTNRGNNFMYDQFTSDGIREVPRSYSFVPKVQRYKTTFEHFHRMMKEREADATVSSGSGGGGSGGSGGGGGGGSAGGSSSSGSTTATAATAATTTAAAAAVPTKGTTTPKPSQESSQQRIYLQQALFAGIGEEITKDFSNFHWVSTTPSIHPTAPQEIEIHSFYNFQLPPLLSTGLDSSHANFATCIW